MNNVIDIYLVGLVSGIALSTVFEMIVEDITRWKTARKKGERRTNK